MRSLALAMITLTAVAAVAPIGCSAIPAVVAAVIDCTDKDAPAIATLKADFLAKLSGGSSWATIEADATKAGKTIGGCAFAEVVQDYLGGTGAPAKGDSTAARNALEDFRRNVAGGASFHTTKGNL